MHVGDEFVHVFAGPLRWLNDDVDTFVDGVEIKVSHYRSDFNQFVEPEFEASHFAVDPYNFVYSHV